MKSIILLYLKIFLILGLLFSLLTALISLQDGTGFDVKQFIFKFVFFGGFMSLFLGTAHILSLKHIGVHSFNSSTLAVKQKKHVSASLNFLQLIHKLKADPSIQKWELTENNSSVVLKTGMSWKGWGERIAITVLHSSDTQTEYEIVSSPILGTALVDNGKNLQNVMQIEKLLS